MGSTYGGNNFPQGGFQGQSYGQSGYGQQYGKLFLIIEYGFE